MDCTMHQCYILFYREQVRRSHYAYCLKMLFTREKYVRYKRISNINVIIKIKNDTQHHFQYLLFVISYIYIYNMDENLL